MQVVSGERSLWTYTLLFTFLQLWGRLSASASSPDLPAPQLDIHLRSRDSVVLICRVPEGYTGVQFLLFRLNEEVDSQELHSGVEQALFTVTEGEGDSELFCCLYKNQQNRYSAFSPYLQIDQLTTSVPPRSFPPPVLYVEPSAGVVRYGDMLTFSCFVPALMAQSQSQSSSEHKQVSFLLLKNEEGTGVTTIIRQPWASQASKPELQPGVFNVGPVRGEEDGKYTCLYQITRERKMFNSTVSNMVQVTITDVLPAPTLVLQQQTEVWRLLCIGSPAYPGAVFSLYLGDNDAPVATYHGNLIHHEAVFPVPVQDSSVAWYRCQYSVFLGGKWSNSEHSLPLAIAAGESSASPTDLLRVDWPLILGSLSAVVLFLFSVALVVMLARRKVKAAAEEKKKRQDAQFWTQVHDKDHVVDLPLSNFRSQDWACGDTSTETTSRSPILNSLTTFTTPVHPIH